MIEQVTAVLETGGLLAMFVMLVLQQERLFTNIFAQVVALMESKNKREFERWEQLLKIIESDRTVTRE